MKKILVVIDMQKDFVDGALGSVAAKAIVPNVCEKINIYIDNKDLIYFTKDTHEENYLETQEGKNLPVRHCIKGTKGWELDEAIQEVAEKIIKSTDGNSVFEKETFGAIELAKMLVKIKDEISEIELVGLCTDICVISNAMLLKAFMPEVKISVDARCCAGVTSESHDNALEAMKMCQIQVINA